VTKICRVVPAATNLSVDSKAGLIRVW
jgi:hypothetical protein